jgi:hypothetical protein
MNLKIPMASIALVFAFSGGSAAFAEQFVVEHPIEPEDKTAVANIAVPVANPVSVEVKRKSPMVSNEELDQQRGGEAIVIANQTLSAVTQGNVLNGGFVAGSVNLTDSALSNFNGVGNILINTGAQVSLQSGMNLTINIGE